MSSSLTKPESNRLQPSPDEIHEGGALSCEQPPLEKAEDESEEGGVTIPQWKPSPPWRMRRRLSMMDPTVRLSPERLCSLRHQGMVIICRNPSLCANVGSSPNNAIENCYLPMSSDDSVTELLHLLVWCMTLSPETT